MSIDQKVLARLSKLIVEGEAVLETVQSRSGYSEAFQANIIDLGDDAVNPELSYKWGTSCLNLLARIFGRGSDHYIKFERLSHHFDDYTPVQMALGILKAAKDDYENGFVTQPISETPKTAEQAEMRAEQADRAYQELLAAIRALAAATVVMLVSATLIFGLAYGTTWGALDWLRAHPNAYGIIIAACVVLFSAVLAIAKREWRLHALLAGVLGGILVIAQIAGGPLIKN